MIKVKQYIKLLEVLSRCLRHKLLLGRLNMEAAILYAVDFMHAVGVPDMFESKEAEIEIHNFRGILPCDVVSVELVMDTRSHKCLRAMSDTFNPEEHHIHSCGCGHPHYHNPDYCEDTFKLQNQVIITTIKEGKLKIAYAATPVDENGFPLLIDDNTYLKALELYIKCEIYGDLYDEGIINSGVMQKALLDYAFRVGLLLSEMTIPTLSEMESLCRSWCTLIQRTTEFDTAFRDNGNREYIRKH